MTFDQNYLHSSSGVSIPVTFCNIFIVIHTCVPSQGKYLGSCPHQGSIEGYAPLPTLIWYPHCNK